MTGPGGVEFLDPEPDPDVERRADGHRGRGGRRGRVARWPIGLAGVAAAAAVLSLVNNGGAPTPAVSSAHRSSAISSASPVTQSAFTSGELTFPLAHGPVVAMAFARGDLAVLEPGYLSILDPTSGSVRAFATLAPEIGAQELGPWSLFANRSTVWAVGHGHVYRFEPGKPGEEDVTSVEPVGPGDGAVLGGSLYGNPPKP